MSKEFTSRQFLYLLGGTPFADAVRHGHKEVQRILIDAGANFGDIDVAQMLCNAAAQNDLQKVQVRLLGFMR